MARDYPVYQSGAPYWARVAAACICSLDGLKDAVGDDGVLEGHMARIIDVEYRMSRRLGFPPDAETWARRARAEALKGGER